MLPITIVSRDAPTIVGLRPQKSAVKAPSAVPSGAPREMTSEYPSDEAMLRPCCTKKVGSQVTNPKIKVLTTIRVVDPTIMRGKSTGLSSEPRLRERLGVGSDAGFLRGPGGSAPSRS